MIAKDANEHVRSVDDARLVSPALMPGPDHNDTMRVGSSPDVTGEGYRNEGTPPSSITTANTNGDSVETQLLQRY